MPLRLSSCGLSAVLFLAPFLAASADTVAISRSPVLQFSAPSGSSYQVQVSTTAGVWLDTGMLIPGRGVPAQVALNGFPPNAAYRLLPVSGSETAIAPSITFSATIATTNSSGAGELRLESATDLQTTTAWTNHAILLPDATGAFLHAIDVSSNSNSHQFFRVYTPATPLPKAAVTFYNADTNANASGFGAVVDDMPAIYREGFIAATCASLYSRNGISAAGAGECYELAGSLGRATVMIADLSPDFPAGTCTGSLGYFDLNAKVFEQLFPPYTGMGLVTWRLVPAPVTGNVKLAVILNSGGYYLELRPYNYRAGIDKLEIRGPADGGTGGTWKELPRTTYNSFVYSGNATGSPLEVRLTSRFDETINFPASPLEAGSRVIGSSQFAVFPDTGPQPIWIVPPVYTDSLGSFPGSSWTTFSSGGTVTIDPAYTASVFSGSASLRVSGLEPWATFSFLHSQPIPATNHTLLEFAIKSGSATPITRLTVALDDTIMLQLPSVDANWKLIRIPLSQAVTTATTSTIRFQNNSGTPQGPVLLDAIQLTR